MGVYDTKDIETTQLVYRISWEMIFATYISVKRETNIKL